VCLLYLIRHGATANNEAFPPRLQGRRADPGLSAHGLEQAQRTARWLGGQGLDAVYSSPLLRARQTADEIAAALRLTVELVDDLIEVDVGRWEELAWRTSSGATPKPIDSSWMTPRSTRTWTAKT